MVGLSYSVCVESITFSSGYVTSGQMKLFLPGFSGIDATILLTILLFMKIFMETANLMETWEDGKGQPLISRCQQSYIQLQCFCVQCYLLWTRVPWQNLDAFLLIWFCFLPDWWPTTYPSHTMCVFSTSTKSLESDRHSGIFLKFVLNYSSESQGLRMELERGPIFPVYIHSDSLCPQNVSSIYSIPELMNRFSLALRI